MAETIKNQFLQKSFFLISYEAIRKKILVKIKFVKYIIFLHFTFFHAKSFFLIQISP